MLTAASSWEISGQQARPCFGKDFVVGHDFVHDMG